MTNQSEKIARALADAERCLAPATDPMNRDLRVWQIIEVITPLLEPSVSAVEAARRIHSLFPEALQQRRWPSVDEITAIIASVREPCPNCEDWCNTAAKFQLRCKQAEAKVAQPCGECAAKSIAISDREAIIDALDDTGKRVEIEFASLQAQLREAQEQTRNVSEQNHRIRERLGWSEGEMVAGNIASYIDLRSELTQARAEIERLKK